MDSKQTTQEQMEVHHVECCPFDAAGENLCDACLSVLEGSYTGENRLLQKLEKTPCSVCGKTGYYKYDGSTYMA